MIYYYIPDFYQYYHINLKLLQLIKEKPHIFYDDFKIGAVYGNFPNCIWNGGRAIFGEHVTLSQMKSISNAFNSLGVPLRLTMTNVMLKDTDVYDRYANYIMRNMDNGINQAIVANPILEEYIRNNYPNYSIIRSVQAAEEIPYDTSDKYIISVLKREKNSDFEFLKNIELKEKIELVATETCFAKCDTAIHYNHTSNRQLYEVEYDYICHNPTFENRNFLCGGNEITITRDKIKNIYEPMGFQHFKIAGREKIIGVNIITLYSHYMVRPEFKDIFYQEMIPMALLDNNRTNPQHQFLNINQFL